MLPSLIAGIVFAGLGWMRAARLGGTTADKAQYAAAYGIPAALAVFVATTIAIRAGWIG